MNFLLEVSPVCKKFDFLLGYMTISSALRQILNIIDFKLKNDDKNPLTFEDKILINEACETMGRLLENVKYLQFNSLV
jgi:hypothetical protein